MYYLDVKTPFILFKETINHPIYVDKSLLIQKINRSIRTDGKYICITRPHGFGKTVNANVLTAYYTTGYDSHELFERLRISKTVDYQKHLNKHHVILIDFSRLPDPCRNFDDYLQWIKSCIKQDIKEAFGKELIPGEPIQELFKKTNESFIFILDEWDSIFYKKFMEDGDKQLYLEFLKGMLKDQPYVELAYMTGVLPIAKYSSGSELNVFHEYNFMNDNVFEDYFGFSETEVVDLCKANPTVPYEELKYWYDGYYKQDDSSIFNPRSVSFALNDGICRNYWTETGPMNEIAHCIEHNVSAVKEDIINMVSGNSVRIKLKGYSAVDLRLNTRDEILSAMVVYGFLSYHNSLLKIPNHELMEKFQAVLERESMGEVSEIVSQSEKLLNATIRQDADYVAKYLKEIHDREIPCFNYNDENSLSCVLTLSYLKARDYYKVTREARSAQGRVDFLFQPLEKGYPAIIMELKYGHTAEEAIQQIKQQNYIDVVRNESDILFVGINYDKNTKQHTCMIEKYK